MSVRFRRINIAPYGNFFKIDHRHAVHSRVRACVCHSRIRGDELQVEFRLRRKLYAPVRAQSSRASGLNKPLFETLLALRVRSYELCRGCETAAPH